MNAVVIATTVEVAMSKGHQVGAGREEAVSRCKDKTIQARGNRRDEFEVALLSICTIPLVYCIVGTFAG